MELSTGKAIELCLAAHQRLLDHLTDLTDETARGPSVLPGWTVGHVLTHLARNAEGHTRRLSGALRGEEVARYPGGSAERDGAIEAGSGRPAKELIADIAATNAELEAVWQESERAGWPHADLMAGDRWQAFASPLRRLREVEIHHYDLGLGYQPSQWSDEYAAWELRQALDNLPGRLSGDQSRALLLWLIGRTGMPELTLGEWS
jgi:maleylpyruvate isomerase